MKESCLHCALIKAAKKWFEDNHATDEEICKMVGSFTAETIAALPGHEGQEFSFHLFGTVHTNRGSLH